MKIQLKRSNVLEDGSAKKPLADQLEYGELAVNYNATDPTIFIKSSDNSIVSIAGASASSSAPDLEEVLKVGNQSTTNGILIGGTAELPNFEISTSGNVASLGYYRSTRATDTDTAFETRFNSAISYKVLGNGSVASGGTIDSTTDQSTAKIFLNAVTGNIRSLSANINGVLTATGSVTASSTLTVTDTLQALAATTLKGAVTAESSLTVLGNSGFSNTTINGTFTAASGATVTGTLSVSGVSTLANTTAGVVTATTYNLGALSVLPESS